METALFWLIWGIVSFYALKTFYYSFDKEKLNKLRKSALGIDASVLILFFLPWMPVTQGGLTGWELAVKGNLLVILLLLLISTSTVFFLINESTFLKIGASLQILSSILFIIAMILLSPGTIILSINILAPIVASFLLMVGNVIVLMLWQQIQLKQKKGKR